MKRQRFLSDWSWFLLATALIFFLMPRMEAIPRPFKKIAIVAAIMVLAAPRWLAEVLRPPPFEMTVWGKKVDYDFADPDDAEAFYELNRDLGARIEDR